MLGATILECVFILILGWSGGLVWLCIGYLGLQVFSNTAQGPLQGLLRDRVPPSQLGLASSLKILLDLIGLVIAGLVAGRMLQSSAGGTMMIMLLLIALLLISAAITIFITPEEPAGRANRETQTASDPGSAVGWQAGYRALIAERALFLLGVYGLQAFGQYYLGDVLQVSDPARRAGDLLASVGAGTILLVILGAWLMGRVGAKKVLYMASGITALGLLLMSFTDRMVGVIIFGCLVGAGIGLFLSSNWTLANRLAPEAQSGKFLGLMNLATAGSAAVARLQGPAVDYLNSARPGEWIGYRGVFVFGAACILASALFLARIHQRA
jgi:MFS family permease